jgi:ankyrin repeat protein
MWSPSCGSHLEFVEFMLDEGKANIEERNDREETPLHYAAKKVK